MPCRSFFLIEILATGVTLYLLHLFIYTYPIHLFFSGKVAATTQLRLLDTHEIVFSLITINQLKITLKSEVNWAWKNDNNPHSKAWILNKKHAPCLQWTLDVWISTYYALFSHGISFIEGFLTKFMLTTTTDLIPALSSA